MRKRGRFWVGAVLAGMMLVSLSGCKEAVQWVDKTIIVTASLKKNELFKIGSQVMTVEEAKIFLAAQKSSMNMTYTDQIWKAQAGGQTVGEYMKQDLEDNLAQMICMVQMAEDRGLKLNKTEEANLKKAAETYYYALSENDKQYMQVSLDQAEKAFRHYYLAQKVVDEATSDVDMEVSDDEARIITIQQIFVTDPADAQTVQEKAAGGSDFGALAASYNESSEFEMQIGREDVSEDLARAAFALSSGEVSSVVQTETGYHILRCVSHFDVEETLAHKETIALLRKKEAFQKAYDEYVGGLKSYYNEAAWENVSFEDGFIPSSRSFYDVYQSFFK